MSGLGYAASLGVVDADVKAADDDVRAKLEFGVRQQVLKEFQLRFPHVLLRIIKRQILVNDR